MPNQLISLPAANRFFARVLFTLIGTLSVATLHSNAQLYITSWHSGQNDGFESGELTASTAR